MGMAAPPHFMMTPQMYQDMMQHYFQQVGRVFEILDVKVVLVEGRTKCIERWVKLKSYCTFS